MTESLYNFNEANGTLILDSNIEQRMFACNLISGIEKSQNHIRFILTTEGAIALAEALRPSVIKEGIDTFIPVQKESHDDIKDALLTRKEVVIGLSVSLFTLHKWEKSGYLVPIKVGKRVYYHREDIRKIIQ